MVDTDYLPPEQRKDELLGIMYFHRRCKDTMAVDKVLHNLMQLGMVDSATKPTAADLFAESMESFPQSPVTGENGIGNNVLPRLHYLVSLGIIALMPALQIFAAGKKTPKLDMFNRNLLHVAAERGYTLILEHLLNLTKSHPTFILDIEARDVALRTPMCLAVLHGHESSYRFLRRWGAKLDVRDDTSHSLLASAASGNHIGIMKDLIEAGRPVNENVLGGAYQPLHAAAEKGHLEAVQLLIKKEHVLDF
ncbi:hypothetical protein G7Y79_00002g006020 [Physcia stellaris]|nr:hypothetical protein G7Y79_00002g006020 [Physcia stellaris]